MFFMVILGWNPQYVTIFFVMSRLASAISISFSHRIRSIHGIGSSDTVHCFVVSYCMSGNGYNTGTQSKVN